MLATAHRISPNESDTTHRVLNFLAVTLIVTLGLCLAGCAGVVSGNTSNNVAPQVAPSLSVQPANQSVTVGQAATFSVVATGTAPLTYQWKKNGTAISGAASASYSTPATTMADSGSTFAVVVNNSAGTITSSPATLTVSASAVAPSITTQPAGQTVTVGQTATFTVAATGTAPFSYQWKKNGTAISGATSTSYTTPATTNADNGSQFTVQVSNSAGNVTSNAATLTVSASTVAPSITTQPANQTVTVGQAATFTVAATGTAPLSYQWRKNGTAISGATSTSYTTPATTSADSGSQFTVQISNSAGNVTSNTATLTVNSGAAPPTVPTGLTATAVSSSQINLSWNASTDSTGTLAGYKIFRGGTQVATSTTTSFQDTGLAASTTYSYTAAAFDTGGNTSAQSSAASATTQTSSGSSGCGSSTTALAQVACNMAPGTWAPLNTNNFNNGNELRPPDGGSGLEFNERAQWNPINNTVMILGGAHPANSTNCNSTYLAAYTESTNTWANNLPSPCPNFDNATGIVSTNLVHPYDHQDIDSAGNLYHRQYFSGKVMKFSQSTQSWSQCSPYNTTGVDANNYQAAGSLVYFPDRNSLIFLDGDWGVWELSLSSGNCTGTWNELASTNGGGFSPQLSGLGSYHNVGQYSSLCKCVIIGGNSNQMYKIDGSAKITQLAQSPILLGIPQNPGSPDGSIYTVDPVGGHFLVWSGNGNDNGTAYDYNPLADAWTTTGIKSPIFPGPEGGVTETVAIPIPKYGVIMFVQAGSSSSGAVYLYKHTTGSASSQPVSVAVNPTSANLQTNTTKQFTATVTGSSNTAVTWTATGGTVSGGLFTAPASAGTFTVTATSAADTTKSASATVTVTSGTPVVTVTISPTAATLQTNATKQFTATVTGSSNTAVTWTATGGTITTSGLYTAPGSTGTFTVTATSAADTTKSASAAVTVTTVSSGAVNGWASRIAGVNVPGGASSIVSGQDFDAAPPTCAAPCSTYAPGQQIYVRYYNSGTPASDCTVSADGPCSLKFTVTNGSFQGDAGLYDYNFSPNFANGTGQFGPGQEVFIQYKLRFDPGILGTFSGAGGLKHDITTEGDTSTVSAGDCSNSPGEIVTLQDNTGGFSGPWMYVNCGFSTGTLNFTNQGYSPLQLPGAPSSNFLDQNASGCPHYSNQGIQISDPSCFIYQGNEWFTVQKHIKIGSWGTASSVIEQWFAHASAPSVITSNASDAAIPNDGSGGASGKYGKIQLSTYNTGANWTVNTAAWFDDLIVSTRRIPDPDIANPNAPDSLSLSSITSSSVTVNWRVNSQNGTAQDDTGFLVERCAGNGANCFPNPQSGFAQIGATAPGASSYVDNTVTAGTTYTYRVRAKNASGNSAYTIAQCFNGGTTCGGTVAVP